MALKIKTVTIPTGGLHGRSCHPIWDASAFWAELHESGGLSATLAVYRLGHCRAPRPRQTEPSSICLALNSSGHTRVCMWNHSTKRDPSFRLWLAPTGYRDRIVLQRQRHAADFLVYYYSTAVICAVYGNTEPDVLSVCHLPPSPLGQ